MSTLKAWVRVTTRERENRVESIRVMWPPTQGLQSRLCHDKTVTWPSAVGVWMVMCEVGGGYDPWLSDRIYIQNVIHSKRGTRIKLTVKKVKNCPVNCSPITLLMTHTYMTATQCHDCCRVTVSGIKQYLKLLNVTQPGLNFTLMTCLCGQIFNTTATTKKMILIHLQRLLEGTE